MARPRGLDGRFADVARRNAKRRAEYEAAKKAGGLRHQIRKKRRRTRHRHRRGDGYSPPTTKSEDLLAHRLRKAGIRFVRQYEVKFRTPTRTGGTTAWLDFWLPDLRVVIEVDGGYHRDRGDLDRARMRRVLGVLSPARAVRVWNSEVQAYDLGVLYDGADERRAKHLAGLLLLDVG